MLLDGEVRQQQHQNWKAKWRWDVERRGPTPWERKKDKEEVVLKSKSAKKNWAEKGGGGG